MIYRYFDFDVVSTEHRPNFDGLIVLPRRLMYITSRVNSRLLCTAKCKVRKKIEKETSKYMIAPKRKDPYGNFSKTEK